MSYPTRNFVRMPPHQSGCDRVVEPVPQVGLRSSRKAFLIAVACTAVMNGLGAPVASATGPAPSAFSLASPSTPKAQSIPDIFTAENRNLLVMQIEAAIAQAQAERGVIPAEAAREIASKAHLRFAPLADIAQEHKRVNHRMVALLNVWKRSLSPQAVDYLHFGVTTVDIYDTVRVLQVRDSLRLMIRDMRQIETALLSLARKHRATVMVGRTLGQHALPLTFGKKVAVWAAQNRRNIERMKALLVRIEHMGVLKGAVGTHLGLGDQGIEVEQQVARLLGLRTPDPTDWHGARDNFAEYGLLLALIAKSYASFGDEVFRLQMTDIFEVQEKLAASNVGSSTMPHKRNPRKSEVLIYHGRTIPRLAEVLLDDVQNDFERDNTSRANLVVEDITLKAATMMGDMQRLLSRLVVYPQNMLANLQRTDGMIMSQRIMLFLADKIGRDEAETRVRVAARAAGESGRPFRTVLQEDEVLRPHLKGELDALLDPTTYTGLSAEQVDRTISQIERLRQTDSL